jgi:hypothetical protein
MCRVATPRTQVSKPVFLGATGLVCGRASGNEIKTPLAFCCCATPLGLDAWATGTQGRHSCLAPTLGFVAERRWRSIPVAFNARRHRHQHRHHERRRSHLTSASCASPARSRPASASRTPRAFAQQRAGLASLRAYYAITHESSHYLAYALCSGSIRKKTRYGILVGCQTPESPGGTLE